MELRQYGKCDMKINIPYEINDANPIQVQPYSFLQNPYASKYWKVIVSIGTFLSFY